MDRPLIDSFCTIIFILEYYAFQAVKTVTKNRIIRWGWMAIGILVYLNLLYVIITTTKQFWSN